MERAPRIRPDRTVQEILRDHPRTMPVFARHAIDLCCGGVHSLEFVAAKHKIRLETLLAEIRAAAEKPAVP
ncbi:MAG TPA: DUF542 domain-containing protein [Planctomycetota bacterium]|nr:DUF542 domain-containing protein [Planctomycetota bacterium]